MSTATDRRLLSILVFASGASVMSVEMTALRLLAPYFGTSLLVTTILIGSMMGFLSLGYFLGGRWGDARPTLGSLSKVTALAAGFVLVIPFAGKPILKACSAVIKPLVEGAELAQPAVAVATIVAGLLGTLALFAIPITLMGTVSPWAVRLALEKLDNTAHVAGRLYALSTFGSIIGTFLPALLLIPAMGVRDTFILIGAVLLAVSALGFARMPRAAAPPAAALGLMLVPEGLIRPMDGLVWEGESIYHFIQVVEEPYGKCKDAVHLYLNEGVGVHSVKCPSMDDYDIRGVWTYMAAAPFFLDDRDKPMDVLIVGLAGGTVARQMLEAYPDANIDGVEIDGKVVEVGEKWFDNADPRINPIVMDGRIFLQLTDKKYDIIMMDAYRQPYIPFHLVTDEFFELVYDHLKDDGVLAVNVASVRGVSRTLAQMIYRTMRESFPMTVLVDATQSNDVLFATKQDKSPFVAADALESMGERDAVVGLERIQNRFRKKVMPEVEGWREARLLTDDQAPVEMAWDLMALEYAK